MAENLTFDILVRDRASQQFDKIARSTSTLESRFARFTATARNVATTLIGAQIGKSVLDAADAFETSRSRLETITKNIGANFDQISGQISVADKSMEKFGYTNAQTEGSLASLESATKDPAKALRDLALAADLARGRNISLDEATALLMKVETGHVALLGRYGIATKDATGHTLTQTEALQKLADLYGGAASRYAGTLAGKQAAVGAAMQDTAAQIGVALLPAALDFAKALQHDVLPPLEASAKWMDRNRKVVEPLVVVLGGAVLAWKAYAAAAKLAAAANVLFARSAVGAEAGAVGAGAAAGRGRLLGFAGALAGGAAIYGGQKAGGQFGTALTSTGVGALGGSLFGPVGAGVGAVGGLTYGLTTNALHDFFGDPGAKSKGGAQFSAEFQQQVAALGGLDKALAYYKAQNAAAAASAKGLSGSIDTVTSAATRSADAVVAAAKKNLDLSSAQDSLRQAFQQAAQTAADTGKALVGNSDAALANRNAIRQEASAIFAVIDAMKAHGASAAAQTTELGILEQALQLNADKTYGNRDAVHALLQQLGLIPAAVDAAATALAALSTTQQALLNSDTPSKGAIFALNAGIAKAKHQAATVGKQVADSFTSGYTPVVAKGAAKAASAATKAVAPAKLTMAQLGAGLAAALAGGFSGYSAQIDATIGKSATSMLNKLGGQLNAAAAKYRTDVQAQADLRASTASSIMGNAALSNAVLSNTGGATVGGFLSGQIRQDTTFSRLLAQLRKRGLDPRLIQQLADAGPQQGTILAQQILSGGQGSIRGVNAQERTIGGLSGRIGATVADSSYASRVAQEQKALDHLITATERFVTKKLDLSPHAAVVFERAMEQAIRKAMPTLSVKQLDAALGLKIVSG